MENASKALLIAAGVLIVILIIAVSMKIYNSAGDTASDAQKVGESISSTSSDSSKDAVSALKDITSKIVLTIPDQTLKIWPSLYYRPTPTNFYLQPGKTYQLEFDYEIKSADYEVYCSIGVKEEGTTGDDYNEDIEYTISYPNQTKGTISHKFKYKKKKPMRLGIRFARMNQPGNFEVKISNAKLREVK